MGTSASRPSPIWEGWSVCSVIGLGLVVYICYEVAKAVRLYTRSSSIRRYLHHSADGHNRPPWALVTGASDGTGRALCFELAAEGFNVVLHGRNPSKLAAVQAELSMAHPTRQFSTLVADAFAACSSTNDVQLYFDRIVSSVQDLHLTVLINCAGAGPQPSFGTLEEFSRREILDVIHLNAAFPALMSSALIPKLLSSSSPSSSSPGGPALLLNIASVTDNGMPLVSFYGASKAFGHCLSLSLSREAALEGRSDNLEVASHRLGGVTSTSRVSYVPTLFTPSATTMARAIIGRVGCGQKSVIPYWPHALQQLMLSFFPTAVADKIIIDALRTERDGQDERLGKRAAARAAAEKI